MRGKKFTNEEIKWVREYLDDNYSLGFAKEKATGMQYGKNLGAKSKEEFEFVNEYVDNLNTTSPEKFKEMYGTVKNVNMDISNIIDSKLEKHFKKKYKWDDTKTDGGLDDKTYELYESELFDTQKEFGNFHTMYDTNQRPNIFGFRKGTSYANHPREYLDEASVKMEEITGQGLNVDFLKNYTDEVLSKYPEPEKFQYGGPVLKGPDLGSTAHGSSELASRQRVLQPGGQMTTSTGLNYLLGEDDNNRIPFQDGLSADIIVPKEKPSESYRILEMLDKNKKAAFNTLGAETMFNLIKEHAPKAFEKGEISQEDYNEAMKAFEPKGIAALKKIKAEEEAYLNKYQTGGRIGFNDGRLVNSIPPEYRLYASTMLPWNKTGTVDESYFNQDFKDKLKDQVLNKMDWGMKHGTPKAMFPSGTVREGTIYPQNYMTPANPSGYVDRDSLTGYDSVFNTLGTYNYKYNMPTAPAFDNASIDIIDRYDWNPNYGTVDDFTGYIGSGFGREGEEGYVKGRDVDLDMLKRFAINAFKKRKLNRNDALELVGNYLGPKQSKGEGKDIKINIPTNVSTFAGNEGRQVSTKRGAVRGAQEDISNYQDFGEVPLADGGIARLGFAGGKLADIGRRGFLKFLGGTAAGIAAMKTGLTKLLGGKSAPEVKKVIDEVVVNNKSGAPEWFQPLINKILREGKDANITYGERQIGKVMDTPSGKVDVVYKMDTGEVELSFVGKDTALGEQVDLVYKPGQVIEEGKFAGKKEGDEFIASESVPEGNVSSFGKDVDYSIDVGVKEADNVGELASDLSELKTFATGEKQTIKEIVEGIKKKKTRAKMEKDQGIDYITETQGDIPYASGGLAGMLGE
jgi:hypothetical protein